MKKSGLRKSAQYVTEHTQHSIMMAEIGVCTGVNALAMLKSMKIKMLYLIDPYIPYSDGSKVKYTKNFQDTAYAKTFTRLIPFHREVTFIKQSSAFSVRLFPKELFDYVYIDGNHSYGAVLEDCNLWWRTVKMGGVLAGHDYSASYFNVEVKKAVDEFSVKHNLKVQLFDKSDDWMIIKNNNF